MNSGVGSQEKNRKEESKEKVEKQMLSGLLLALLSNSQRSYQSSAALK